MLGCISDNSVDDSYNKVASRLHEAKKDKQKLQNLIQKVYRLEAEREAEKKLFEEEFTELDKRFEAKLYQLNTAHAIELKQTEESKKSEMIQLHNTIKNANEKIESLTHELNHLKLEFDKERKELMFSRENAADEQRQALLQRAIRAETKLREERIERKENKFEDQEISTTESNLLLSKQFRSNFNFNANTSANTSANTNSNINIKSVSNETVVDTTPPLLSVTIPRPSPIPRQKLHQQSQYFCETLPSSSSTASEHNSIELPSLIASNMNKSSVATINSMTTPTLNRRNRPLSAKSMISLQSPYRRINRRELKKIMTTEVHSQLEMPECVTLSNSISINSKEAKKLESTSPQPVLHERIPFSQQAKRILLGSMNELSPGAHDIDVGEYVIA